MAEDKKIQPHHRWWTIWEQDGRTYAEPHQTIAPAKARDLHREHLEFRWATGLDRPSVSPRWFINEDNLSKQTSDGAWGDLPSERAYTYAIEQGWPISQAPR